MSLRRRLHEMQWTVQRKWLGIWEVRDYYTELERRAQACAEITVGYILMVMVSAILASGGLLLNNPAVVIGSMCVAPFLGPSRAVCIGGLFRNRRIFLNGLAKQLFGLLTVGAGLAYVIAALLRVAVPGVEITPEILLRAMPTPEAVVLSVLIAVAAGAAAALALSSDPRVVQTPWGQVVDAVVGVEIAISLIPPASVVGIGLAFGRLDISRNALLLLLVNVLGLDILGSMLMLAVRGIRADHLALEKAVRQAVESALVTAPEIVLAGSTIHVTLLNDVAASISVTARSGVGAMVPESLAQTIATNVQERTSCRSEVAVEVIPFQTYSTL
jgi:uncharacterized hydrophobic protein (TIGR00271 family)